MDLKCTIIYANGKNKHIKLKLLVNTSTEIEYSKNWRYSTICLQKYFQSIA